MFYKIKGNSVIPKELNDKEYYFIDDIATHLSGTFQRSDIPNIKISMLPNPSHLEVGGAVGMGKSRAKIDAGIDTSHI